ncbi:CaiB/BaiF CoA transferase family protein [Chloroflexota bacterium]
MGVLSGIRIVEVASAMVGPLATDILALMGAEVIKLESRRKLELTRLMLDISGSLPDPDMSPRFNEANLNKKGICLDLSKPEGLELAKKLITVSDVVVENYAGGVIDKLGLGYEVLKEIKPDIIMVSASTSGHTGPEANVLGYAPLFGAFSGLSEITGYPDTEPFVGRMSMDSVNAVTITYALLAALWHLRNTGEGQFIDYSSREGISSCIGDSLMDYTMNRTNQSRRGNRDDIMAPHNTYPCKGQDKWVSIAVATEEEWKAFCDALGNPEWTKEEKFSDAYSRWQNHEELDKLVREWTVNYTPYEIMETLQKAGVAGIPSFSAEDLYTDPHLGSREFLEVVEHPKLGAVMVIRNPWRMSATPPEINRHAPLLGEHTEYVLGEILGIGNEEIASLNEAKVTW